MNIFEQANISRKKGYIVSRLERVKREGSPNYDYVLPATAAGVTVILSIPTLFPLSRKYEPLDSIEIVNNEATNPLLITINNTDAYGVPAGSIRLIHGRGIALWQVAITNQGAGITTLNLVRLTMKKEAMTIDKWASEH